MKCERIVLDDDNGYLDTYISDPIVNFTRKALLVIPGGGYRKVCGDREGEPIAQAFIPYGYQAFVLNYYVDAEKPFPIQLIQVAKAIKHIKDNADKYGLNPEEIFVVGFSAGGHLAASAGVLWKTPEISESLGVSCDYVKPTGVMLIYPVISATEDFMHAGSIRNLWATDEPTEKQRVTVSIEKQVDADSAPAFIVHTSNDQIVDVRNSLALASAYRKAGLKFELHVFPDAPHGWGLGNAITSTGKDKFIRPAASEWVRMASVWADGIIKENQNI